MKNKLFLMTYLFLICCYHSCMFSMETATKINQVVIYKDKAECCYPSDDISLPFSQYMSLKDMQKIIAYKQRFEQTTNALVDKISWAPFKQDYAFYFDFQDGSIDANHVSNKLQEYLSSDNQISDNHAIEIQSLSLKTHNNDSAVVKKSGPSAIYLDHIQGQCVSGVSDIFIGSIKLVSQKDACFFELSYNNTDAKRNNVNIPFDMSLAALIFEAQEKKQTFYLYINSDSQTPYCVEIVYASGVELNEHKNSAYLNTVTLEQSEPCSDSILNSKDIVWYNLKTKSNGNVGLIRENAKDCCCYFSLNDVQVFSMIQSLKKSPSGSFSTIIKEDNTNETMSYYIRMLQKNQLKEKMPKIDNILLSFKDITFVKDPVKKETFFSNGWQKYYIFGTIGVFSFCALLYALYKWHLLENITLISKIAA